LLRPDSIVTASQSGGTMQILFSGAEGYGYAVQTSSNLLDWASLSTNHPTNRSFTFTDTPPPASHRRFYRSALLP
jgi:hypothetical protein